MRQRQACRDTTEQLPAHGGEPDRRGWQRARLSKCGGSWEESHEEGPPLVSPPCASPLAPPCPPCAQVDEPYRNIDPKIEMIQNEGQEPPTRTRTGTNRDTHFIKTKRWIDFRDDASLSPPTKGRPRPSS